MNSRPIFPRAASLRVVVVCALMALGLTACHKPAPAPPTAAKGATPVKPAVAAPVSGATNDMSRFQSVFEDLSLKVGKDPFFPNSTRREPAPPPAAIAAIKAAAAPVAPDLILKGVVGSPGHYVAIINSTTLAPGETSKMLLPGHVTKCQEIGPDYVVLQVEGEPQPRRVVQEPKR